MPSRLGSLKRAFPVGVGGVIIISGTLSLFSAMTATSLLLTPAPLTHILKPERERKRGSSRCFWWHLAAIERGNHFPKDSDGPPLCPKSHLRTYNLIAHPRVSLQLDRVPNASLVVARAVKVSLESQDLPCPSGQSSRMVCLHHDVRTIPEDL